MLLVYKRKENKTEGQRWFILVDDMYILLSCYASTHMQSCVANEDEVPNVAQYILLFSGMKMTSNCFQGH